MLHRSNFGEHWVFGRKVPICFDLSEKSRSASMGHAHLMRRSRIRWILNKAVPETFINMSHIDYVGFARFIVMSRHSYSLPKGSSQFPPN